MPLFKLPFEANFPINTPFEGHAQPPLERSAAGTWVGAVDGVTTGAVVAVLVLFGGGGVPAGRRVTVVLLDGEVEVTTREDPAEDGSSKRIACPGRMV